MKMKKKTRTRYTYAVSRRDAPLASMSPMKGRVYSALVEKPGTNKEIAKRFHKGNSKNAKPAIAAFFLMQLWRAGFAIRKPAPLKGKRG